MEVGGEEQESRTELRGAAEQTGWAQCRSQGGRDGATVVCGHLHQRPSLYPCDGANEASTGQDGLSQGTETWSPISVGTGGSR